jgi:hypothetical protein
MVSVAMGINIFYEEGCQTRSKEHEISTNTTYKIPENERQGTDNMGSDRIPRKTLKYQPKEKRNLARPLKLWKSFVRFEAFTAVTMKNGVSWDIMLCGSCKNRRFGGT